MALRNIVKIDRDKCNGCGACVTACAEGAIAIVDGKAQLISEVYCDGLGACMGHCPQDAITIEQRQAADFDEKATEAHLAQQRPNVNAEPPCTCPGLAAKDFTDTPTDTQAGDVSSQLRQWPVQMRLLAPTASYLQNADLLLVADCVPLAMGDFHTRLLKGHAVAVGCPKLDDAAFYIDKLKTMIQANDFKSLTVVHMEVPCCSGLTRIAKEAIRQSGVALSFEDIMISIRGRILQREVVHPVGA
jgi:Pyruvate/2-oxoacid:ferredoxin oxidoreductase delta subunit